MKRTSFLARLKKEKKIQAVEPNEEVKTAHLQRPEESLRSAKVLLHINNLKGYQEKFTKILSLK